MPPLVFVTKIHDGKTTCSTAIAAALKCFNGKTVAITITERKRGRSNPQNRYYHAVCIPVIVELLRHFGNDADADIAHALCKDMFIPPSGVKKVKVGKITHESRSTTWLSSSEFEDYLERIRVFAAENGFQIMLPNEGLYG